MPGRLLAVADCGLGNLHSLLGALVRLAPGDRIELTADADIIGRADAVFLPGDGSFGACMAEMDARGLRAPLLAAARAKPFFGICVGMQALFEGSAEAPSVSGLGVLQGTAARFPSGHGIKVPLMGWLDVAVRQRQHRVFADVAEGERFYFLHSYCLPAQEASALVGRYAAPFAAAVASGDLVATQFHPEKSHEQGLGLIKRFLDGVAAAA